VTQPSTGGPTASEVQFLHAREISVPIGGATGPSPSFSPELVKLRADFLAGRDISADDLNRLMVATAEDTAPANANCYIC
jgi:hypothetical protein